MKCFTSMAIDVLINPSSELNSQHWVLQHVEQDAERPQRIGARDHTVGTRRNPSADLDQTQISLLLDHAVG